MDNQKPQEIKTKIITIFFGVLLLIYAIIPLFILAFVFVFPEKLKEISIQNGFKLKSTGDMVLSETIRLLYLVIGAIGLLRKRLWAVYFVAIPAIYFFIITVMDFIMVSYLEPPYRDYYWLIINSLLGLGSFYILSKRNYFLKKI